MKHKNKIFSTLQDSKNLPALPQVLLQLIEACEKEDMLLSDLSNIIIKDPSISSKILCLINSAYFGLRTTYTSIQKAVVYLGADTIKNISIAASVHQVFNGLKNSGHCSLSHFWWNSFSSATYAKRIAKEIGYANPEEAYLSALLHDLGELLLWMNFAEEYPATRSPNTDKAAQCLREKEHIGIDHCEAGAWLATQWKLSSFIVDTILYHHASLEQIKGAFPLVKLVYFADKCCQINDDEHETLYAIGDELLHLDKEQIHTVLAGVDEEVAAVAADLSIGMKPPRKGREQTYDAKKPELDLQDQVKNYSLLSGFLENLLQAESRDDLFKAAEHALKIFFDFETIFFFLHDFQESTLYGCTSKTNPFSKQLQGLTLSMEGGASLLTKSMLTRQLIPTLQGDQHQLQSMADSQLLDAMGGRGMLYIPMVAKAKQVGVIVVGLHDALDNDFSTPQKSRLLRLVAGQIALSFYLVEVKEKHGQEILEAQMKTASMAAAKIAHEVNNPLGIIKNYLKILEMKVLEAPPVAREFAILNEEIDRVSALVQQLDNFSIPDQHDFEHIDINSLISKVLSILDKSLFYSSKLQIHFSPGSNLPKILSNADALKQILINLLKNAAEALAEGGNVYLATGISSAPEHGNTSGSHEKRDMIQITIQDDGPGIPEEVLAQLFTPFTSTKGKGHAGLGLSIVHGLVKELKGFISCREDNGTCFTIMLPAEQDSNTE